MSTETQSQTMTELLTELGVSMKIIHRAHPVKVTEWQSKANAYRVKLSYEGRNYSLYYYAGRGIESEPTASDVIYCLSNDASYLESCSDLKCFGDCMGWNSETANTYRAIKRQTARFHKLIGDASALERIATLAREM
jgi:hypothetical protein